MLKRMSVIELHFQSIIRKMDRYYQREMSDDPATTRKMESVNRQFEKIKVVEKNPWPVQNKDKSMLCIGRVVHQLRPQFYTCKEIAYVQKKVERYIKKYSSSKGLECLPPILHIVADIFRYEIGPGCTAQEMLESIYHQLEKNKQECKE